MNASPCRNVFKQCLRLDVNQQHMKVKNLDLTCTIEGVCYNQTGSKKYDNGRNERNEKIRKLQEGF